MLAVWWVWIYTTWALNWLDPQATPVRLMLYASMLLGLFMSMSIPEAFGDARPELRAGLRRHAGGPDASSWSGAWPATCRRATAPSSAWRSG